MVESDFRLAYGGCRALLVDRLQEPAPGRIQLLAGPRQVGKTTLLLEIAASEGEQAIYSAADSPEASLPGYWDRIWIEAERIAASRGRAVVLLDEVHLFADWSHRVKAEWDRLKRKKVPVHIVATGSSALRVGTGSRESLAGRFERMTLTHWQAASLVEVFKIPRDNAAETIVRTGGYPGAFAMSGDPGRWLAYVRDAIVEPAIGRDILALAAVRKPALLRQVFAVAASLPAQIVSLQKIQGQLRDGGALETVAHYLALLEDAYLIASLAKFSQRPARSRSAPPKLVALSNALLAVMDPRGVPDLNREPDRAGHWIENACLAFAWNSGQHIHYWREEPFEVDGVIDGSWGALAVEIKTGPIRAGDLRGLLEFTRRFPKYRPLLVCDSEGMAPARRAGVAAMMWRDFLIAGPSDVSAFSNSGSA